MLMVVREKNADAISFLSICKLAQHYMGPLADPLHWGNMVHSRDINPLLEAAVLNMDGGFLHTIWAEHILRICKHQDRSSKDT